MRDSPSRGTPNPLELDRQWSSGRPHLDEIEQFYRHIRRPGNEAISDAADIDVHPDGQIAAFTGFVASQSGELCTRIYRIDRTSSAVTPLVRRQDSCRSPRYSPDGRLLAYLVDADGEGDFQLALADRDGQDIGAVPRVEGWIEYCHWSPDGKHILLGVAGHGADRAGADGGVTSARRRSAPAVSWEPMVDAADDGYKWRRLWLYSVVENRMRLLDGPHLNIWDAVWCGAAGIAAVASPGPEEGLWYSATVEYLAIDGQGGETLRRPEAQLGCLAASPDGRWIAIVEGFASDRKIVAGDLYLIDRDRGISKRVDVGEMDVAHVEWRSEHLLLLAGHRGFETVVARFDIGAGHCAEELWSNTNITTGGYYAKIAGAGEAGDCMLVGEGFEQRPEIATIEDGRYRTLCSFDLDPDGRSPIAAVEPQRWNAPDGLGIEGWLLSPHGEAPYPLIMVLHGGPVWHSRPRWLGRTPAYLSLLERGFALFFPNPRGSSGRGQAFARFVQGDLCGADAIDCLSGLDRLIERGIADAKHLGVTGTSYGGMMTYHLVAATQRFAAAVAVSPIANLTTQFLLSNIGAFVELFDRADFAGSTNGALVGPIACAHKVTTPTLNICGALDRCTPPIEAAQFHSAVRAAGGQSVLVTYPFEGHGVRQFPASLDYAARLLGWFTHHLAPGTDVDCPALPPVAPLSDNP